jgi:hypothetical protein
MHDVNLDELSRRPLRTAHADGINELFMGLTWLLWGVLIGLPFLVPRGGWWKPYWFVTPFVLVASGFVSQWLMGKSKERWSYPRAGYVEFAAPKHRRLMAGLAAALISVAIGVSAKSRTLGELLPLGVSVAVAAALMFGLRHSGLVRAGFYSAAAVALGIAVTVARLSMDLAFGALWVGLGVTMAIGGGFRLLSFIRRHESLHG